MDVLISITGKIAELTVAPVNRQVGYLLFYKENFKKLMEQIVELETMKERIQHNVEAERRNGREIEADVLIWQNRVDETIKEAKQLCDDPHHANVGCSRWSFPNMKSRHQLSRNASKMVENIAQVQEKGRFEHVGFAPLLDIANNISTTRGSEKLESRKLVKKSIMLCLRDPKISKIGVYGLSGVGKTTLVKEVAKQVKDDKLFDVVVMATISQTLDIERIQDVIADQLGLHFEEITTVGRANKLCERIKKEKSILIILDDIWEKVDLEKLGIPCVDIQEKNNLENVEVSSKDNYEGCKLLLTSRNQDILLKNETQKSFILEVLDDLESRRLFEDMVGDIVKDANLQNIATQVAQRCAGLPVLIVTTAKSLKDKDIYYWKDVLDNLGRVDNRGMHETALSALESSFNLLEDEVKEVFLLCAALGTSTLFSDLLKYVIGGVLKYIKTIEGARNRLYRIIHDLKASCLLLQDDVSAGEIKMHDIVREVAVSIASRNQYVFTLKGNVRLQDWPRKGFLERCTQMIFVECFIQKLPEKLDCPNLKIFHLSRSDNGTFEFPLLFFEGMGNLEALYLKGMIISSFPISLVTLTKLKTFCLDHCSLKCLAGIGALINLEILSFIHSSMEEFPCEIGQLTHLRMLDLSNSGIEIIPSNIFSMLTNIEELYMGNTSIKWEAESSTKSKKNASLAELGYLTNLTTLEIQIREAWILPRDIMSKKLERYKVVIGDKWEWSDNKKTSRLLKLKLDTSIHLEHGIKELITKVEDLYLDEVKGVSNVLFQLSGEGFPLLKHLYIQNNGEIQHIINMMGRKQSHILFPKLEMLILHNLNNLVNICHGLIPVNSFGKLTVIKVKSCGQLVYLFSISMAKALSQLLEIEVSECNLMKMIVFAENVDSDITIDNKIEFYCLRSLSLCHLPIVDDFCSNELTSSMTTMQNSLRTNVPTSFFNSKVNFSSLETLKLISINLEKIWDDNELCAAYSIQNVANLTIEDCSGLKYLFSSSIIGILLNLKQLEISKCDMMEEIIDTKETYDTALDEVRFSKLETLVINNMKNLKKVWHFQFDGLKNLEVNNCEKLENVFPSHMQGTFGSLETLKVSNCGSMKEIFELTTNEILSEEDTTTQAIHLRKITIYNLPKLQYIWKQGCQEIVSFEDSADVGGQKEEDNVEIQHQQPLFSIAKVNQNCSRDPQSSLRFQNLQVVHVQKCNDLEYLFPFFIAVDLLQLEEITIITSDSMKRIVSDKKRSEESPVIFEFNHMTSLVLWNLSELDGFFAGNHSLTCPSLKVLDVCNCSKLKLFNTRYTSSHARVSSNILPISIWRPLFNLEEVIGNIEKLNLDNEDASTLFQWNISMDKFHKVKFLRLFGLDDALAAFPYWILQNIISLEWLVIQSNSFIVIFPDEKPLDVKGQNEIKTRLKKLTLFKLHELQYICKEGFKIDPVLEVLEYLFVDQCSNLKHLLPSSATFSHLTNLYVQNCNGLIDLISSSTARSLVKLTTMKIGACSLLEQVLAKEKEETQLDEIEFSSLETLVLESLPKLKMFCSNNCSLKLPLLKTFVLLRCPRMESFSVRDTSAPILRKIQTDKEEEKWCWEGDLNITVNKMFQDMEAFTSFSQLELSEYPELKEIWYGQVGQKIFCNLKNLGVHKCTFLSNIIFSSSLLQLLSTLEELEVTECDSLEVVFDIKVLDNKEMHSKEVSRLKKLTLLDLPNLKHIWKEDPEDTLSFKNLQVVKVTKCQNLKNMFWLSLCRDLKQLEELSIDSCGVERIVAIDEGSEELQFFDLPQLSIFRLICLMQLTDFYPKRYTLECPSLKILNVGRCEALQIFAFGHLDSQKLTVGHVDMPIQQPLFHMEKVFGNLEELSLNGKDAMRILNGNYERSLFQSIEMLHLQNFQETPMIFLNALLERFPSVTMFQVRWSSFETLLPLQEMGHFNLKSPTSRIKKLTLYQLKQLKLIWDDDWASTSFTNLTALTVEECNGLIYLVTSLTAKSLVCLKWLTVEKCGMLEEVVMTDKGESEQKITFESLKYLELTCLSNFKSFSFGKHMFIFPSLVSLKVIGCHKMQNFSSGVIIAPFLRKVEVENGKNHWKEDLNTTIKQLFTDKAIREQDEGSDKECSSNITESRASSSEDHVKERKADEIVDRGKQEIHKLSILDTGIDTQKMCEIAETPLDHVSQNTLHITKVEAVIETQEMHEATEGDLAQAAQSTINTIVQDAAIDLSPSQALDILTGTSSIQDAGNHELNEAVERPLVRITESTRILNTIHHDTVYNASGTQEIYQTLEKLLVQSAQNTLKLTTIQNAAVRIQDMYETIEGRLVQTGQTTLRPPTIQDTEIIYDSNTRTQEMPLVQAPQKVLADKSHVPKMLSDENLPSQTTNFAIAETRATTVPSPSQGSEAMSLSTLVADAWLPYLEAGVRRHPQVLDWLNTKQRRAFASLFTEVTRILRTTRRGNLTEDDRNYIRECCTALEVVGFEASWLNYVYGCIEECDDREDIKQKLEEAEAKASILETELASVKASLVLLREKASKLNNFIES